MLNFTALAALALLIALMAAIDLYLAVQQAPAPAAALPPELAAFRGEAHYALCEPLVSTAALLAMVLLGLPAGGPLAILIAAVALAYIVALPRLGGPLQDPALRAARGRLLRLSLARWATLIAPAALSAVAWGPLAFVGAALTWRTSAWGGNLLANVLVPPAPPRRQAPRPVVAPAPAAPPPPPPAPPTRAQLALAAPAGPPLPCASCGALAPLREPVCPGCGLLFASRVPAALGSLTEHGYQVLRPLGAGGMSAVYLAYDSAARGWCCVKTIISMDPSGDMVWRDQAVASLAREAHVLVDLSHPQVSRISDWLDHPVHPCLVLRLVAGVPLEQLLARQGGAPLPAQEVRLWGRAVAEVLSYLAAQRPAVVHGDIKPGNLLLPSSSARPTLVDFGSAALLVRGGPALQAHDALGTPGYAAPEQYRGQIGLASDIYGLGATLYHLLTGDDPTQHPLEFPALGQLSEGPRQLLESMLTLDPGARPGAIQLLGAYDRLLSPRAA